TLKGDIELLKRIPPCKVVVDTPPHQEGPPPPPNRRREDRVPGISGGFLVPPGVPEERIGDPRTETREPRTVTDDVPRAVTGSERSHVPPVAEPRTATPVTTTATPKNALVKTKVETR